MEGVLIKEFEKTHGISVTPCEQITRYCTIGSNSLDTKKTENCYRLIGRADGEYNDVVIECKCRRNGFRTFFFERIQLALYVLGYGKKSGRLVEFFEGKIKVYVMEKTEAEQIFNQFLPSPIGQHSNQPRLTVPWIFHRHYDNELG